MIKITSRIKKYLAAGGGLLAFALAAIQTTLLSLHVAHNSDSKTLTSFSFLLSIMYFSVLICRRNIIEPYLSNRHSSHFIKKRINLFSIFIFLSVIYSYCIYLTNLYALTLLMFLANISILFWEIRKAIMRKFEKIRDYTIFEFLGCLMFGTILMLDFFKIHISVYVSILLFTLSQLIYLLVTRNFHRKTLTVKGSFDTDKNISVHPYGEFVFIGTILITNLYLMSKELWEPLAEIKVTFLFLTLSTFTVGALRNSLTVDFIVSKLNLTLTIIFVANIFLVGLVPDYYLDQLTPKLQFDLRTIMIPIVVDISGSLIFSICSIFLLKKNILIVASVSRIASSLILLLGFYLIPSEELSSLTISWIYAYSSIIGSTTIIVYLLILKLIVLAKKKLVNKN
jgi:hypothetical protein